MRNFVVALALAQPAGAGTAFVPPIDPAQVKLDWSPERVTWETAKFDCKISMENGSTSSLSIIRSGGRGFRHPVTGKVASTTVKVALSGSGAARFSDYSIFAEADNFVLVERSSSSASWKYKLQLLQTESSYEEKSRSRYAIILQTTAWPNGSRISGVGYCRASFRSQKPLSDSEAQDYVREPAREFKGK